MWILTGKRYIFGHKTYHMSISQNCLLLFMNFSTFVRVCVSAYVVEKQESACLRTVGVYVYVALTLNVHGRKSMLRKAMTGNL